MYSLMRPLLFALPPETAHALSIKALQVYGTDYLKAKPFIHKNPVTIAGLSFPSRVGIAAGYDKNAQAILGLAALGASHIEVGTLTLEPQEGNPRPRIFRLRKAQGLINRMGFPNQGVDAAIPRLIAAKKARPDLILGVNIGKSKDSPLHEAHLDYCALLKKLSRYCDYITVNISSPNTQGLRALQGQSYLGTLLEQLLCARDELGPGDKLDAGDKPNASGQKDRKLPIFIKIAPDLDAQALKSSIATLLKAGVDGVIATNTTLERSAVLGQKYAEQSGGLSGAALYPQALDTVRKIRAQAPDLPLIAAGGIDCIERAQQMLDAGADVLQIYTGLVYKGPSLFKKLNAAP